ncbi:MAG TPA: sulfur carrier protein ThiS [Candidatus Baltobacteraceae bacterium]|nr:sulfur carrier protein ThiS [Candidatus Baltobacteraceae bacterium]
MRIVVNGEERSFDKIPSLAELLGVLGVGGAGTAIALNERVVRRADLDATSLCEGDRIEIIRAVAGG